MRFAQLLETGLFYSCLCVGHYFPRLDSRQLCLDPAPLGEGPVLGQVLDVDPVGLEPALGTHVLVLLAVPLGEAPLLGHVDLEEETPKISHGF